jgi:hypothetical protein
MSAAVDREGGVEAVSESSTQLMILARPLGSASELNAAVPGAADARSILQDPAAHGVQDVQVAAAVALPVGGGRLNPAVLLRLKWKITTHRPVGFEFPVMIGLRSSGPGRSRSRLAASAGVAAQAVTLGLRP